MGGKSLQQEVVFEEWNGSSSSELRKTAIITASPSLSIQRSGSRFRHVGRRLFDAFVPEGFPSSVTPDYVPFQIWDSLQGLSTYIRTMLSTQALLSAIGVGEKSATVIGATFQWFLRDLTGMLGGILFTFYQGSNLDSNAKMWRLVADLMNDLGMLMDLVSPLFPSAFMPIVCLGSLSRSFTGVASGATRAALTQHFALHNNAADISAKEGSQETVATMIGMAIGMLLAHITMGSPLAIWLCFLSLTLFHMYANFKAVCCLALTSLNPQRCSIALQHFIQAGEVLSPEQVSKMEHVLPSWASSWSVRSITMSHTRVKLGARISSLHQTEMKELLRLAGANNNKGKYLLVERKGIISVVAHKDATANDIFQSFVHALVMASVPDQESRKLESISWMDKHYESFIQKVGKRIVYCLLPFVGEQTGSAAPWMKRLIKRQRPLTKKEHHKKVMTNLNGVELSQVQHNIVAYLPYELFIHGWMVQICKQIHSGLMISSHLIVVFGILQLSFLSRSS